MASYYPEGECFFRTTSLNYPGWSARNADQFYNHILIEYQWNGWIVSGSSINNANYAHRRSSLVTGRGVSYRTWFGVYNRFFVGESITRDPGDMQAITSYAQSENFNECRDLDRGGPRRYIIRPIRIRSRNMEWLWIDGTLPLRAIYFPLCHQSDEAFPDYCTYAVIDFRARASISVANLVNQRDTIRLTPEGGLGFRRELTWGFNVPNIITYLALPRQLRNPEQGLFQTAKRGDELFVRAHGDRSWGSRSPHIVGPFYREMDLARIISVTFGVEVGWRPYKHSSFLANLVRRTIQFGLGFVPGVGPILAVSFGIAWQLIEDPGSFAADNILDLTEAILEVIIDSATKGRKFMADDITSSNRRQIAAAPSLTEEERKTRQEEGDAANAHLTEAVREKLGSEDPPLSPWWLERIADCERRSKDTEEDDAENDAENDLKDDPVDDAEGHAEGPSHDLASVRRERADDGDGGNADAIQPDGGNRNFSGSSGGGGGSGNRILFRLDTGHQEIVEAHLRFK